jgi:hypothetical protein
MNDPWLCAKMLLCDGVKGSVNCFTRPDFLPLRIFARWRCLLASGSLKIRIALVRRIVVQNDRAGRADGSQRGSKTKME